MTDIYIMEDGSEKPMKECTVEELYECCKNDLEDINQDAIAPVELSRLKRRLERIKDKKSQLLVFEGKNYDEHSSIFCSRCESLTTQRQSWFYLDTSFECDHCLCNTYIPYITPAGRKLYKEQHNGNV